MKLTETKPKLVDFNQKKMTQQMSWCKHRNINKKYSRCMQQPTSVYKERIAVAGAKQIQADKENIIILHAAEE